MLQSANKDNTLDGFRYEENLDSKIVLSKYIFKNVIWYTDVYITCYFSAYIKLKYLIFFRISRWNTCQPTT